MIFLFTCLFIFVFIKRKTDTQIGVYDTNLFFKSALSAGIEIFSAIRKKLALANSH